MISKKVGRLEYIEPNNVSKINDSTRNKIENDRAMPYNLEDLSIAVDFYVLPTSRFNCGNPKTDGNTSAIKYSSKNGSISFFGGRVVDTVDQGGYGDVTVERRMMTTDFTDVSLVNPVGNTNECVGITSINVKYNKNLTPEVTIVFEDVYGASIIHKEELGVYKALMAEAEKKKTKSLTNVASSNLMSALFSMPYPTFVLVLKGYFGKPVAYHLTCTGTQVRFSENNGNFVLTCSFIGSLYGSLADIPMTMLSCAPYIENGYSGRRYWYDNTNISNGNLNASNGFFLTDSDGNNPVPMPTFSEMLQQILNCNENLKKTFSSRDEVQDYQKLLLTKKKLDELNFPLSLRFTDRTVHDNEWYCRRENNIIYYYYVDIETNELKKTECSDVENKIYQKLSDFSDKINDLNVSSTYASLPNVAGMLDNPKFIDYMTSNGFIKKLFPKFFILKDATSNKFSIIKENSTSNHEDNDEIIDYQGETIKTLKRKYNALSYFLETQSDNVTYSHINKDATRISVYEIQAPCDYRSEIELQKNNVISEIKARKNNIEGLKRDALVDLYGYVPSIENVYDIVFAHLDTFMKCFYECLSNIETKKLTTDRSLSRLGVKLSETDLPTNFDTNASLPPFTYFYGKTIRDGKTTTEIKWPEEVSEKMSDLEEVKFVNAILNAVDEYQKDSYDYFNTGTTTYGDDRIPANVYEYIENIKNPYISVVPSSKNSDFISYVFLTFVLRLYYYLSTTKAPNINAFAKIEFTNFISVFDKSYSKDILNNLIQLYNTYGVKKYLDVLFGLETPEFEGIYDNPYMIGDNGTVFEKMEDGSVNYIWHNETVTNRDKETEYSVTVPNKTNVYTLPIGEYGKKKLGYNFVHNLCSDNINFLNIDSNLTEKNINNRKNFLIVPNPNKILNYYENKKFSLDVENGSDENNISLIDMYFSDMQQYKDDNRIYTNKIFQNPTKTTLSGMNLSILSKQGAIANDSSYFDIEKNTISTAFSKVKLGRNSSDVNNVFQTGIYYNQNSIVNNETRKNCAKAYLLLFSIKEGLNDFKKKIAKIGESNGFSLLVDLLREGAFYWRMKYMLGSQSDPINLDGTKFLHADAFSMYSDGLTLYFDELDTTRYIKIVDTTATTFYAAIKDIGVSVSRVESLINLFVNWSNGDKTFEETTTTFQHLVYFLELSTNEGILNLEGFQKLSGQGILDTLKVKIKEDDGTENEIDKYIIDESHHLVYKSKENSNGGKMKLTNGRMYISNIEFYMPSDTFKNKKASEYTEYQTYQHRLIEMLFDTYFVYDASLFTDNVTRKKNVTYDNLKNGIDYFMSYIKEYGYDINANASNISETHYNKLLTTDLKLSLYIKLKAIYDRWCCNYDFNHWKYVDSSKNPNNELETISGVFEFNDLYSSPIGKKLLVNLSEIGEVIRQYVPNSNDDSNILKNRTDDSLLNYLSTVADKSNCMFMALPQKFGGKNFKTMEEVFKPISYNDIDIITDTTTFLVMYKPTLSEHLDNGDEYGDDGYDMADALGNINPQLPDEFGEYGENGNRVPGFGVTIGKGNQSYFTNITLDTSKSQVTDASIATLLNVINKSNSGGREVISFGQDLYRMFSNYSYAVTVKMLGCAQIMPMMYFQLNNVPLFHGSYMIYDVTHDISNGTFMTTFTGNRISKRSIPIQPGNVLITNSSDFGLDGEDNIEEINTSFWDVNVVEEVQQPSLSNVYSRKAINNAIDYVNYVKTVSDTVNAYKKIKSMMTSQETAWLSYVASYSYNIQCLEDIDDKFDRGYYTFNENPIYEPWLNENSLFDASSRQFRRLLKNNNYTTEITIGESITGDKIEENINGLHLQDGDILVYWADCVNDTYVEENYVSSIDLSRTEQYRGCAIFFYGDDKKDGNNSAYHYKKITNDQFIYTGTKYSYDKMCFLWTVKIYRRDGTPIGNSGISE